MSLDKDFFDPAFGEEPPIRIDPRAAAVIGAKRLRLRRTIGIGISTATVCVLAVGSLIVVPRLTSAPAPSSSPVSGSQSVVSGSQSAEQLVPACPSVSGSTPSTSAAATATHVGSVPAAASMPATATPAGSVPAASTSDGTQANSAEMSEAPAASDQTPAESGPEPSMEGTQSWPRLGSLGSDSATGIPPDLWASSIQNFDSVLTASLPPELKLTGWEKLSFGILLVPEDSDVLISQGTRVHAQTNAESPVGVGDVLAVVSNGPVFLDVASPPQCGPGAFDQTRVQLSDGSVVDFGRGAPALHPPVDGAVSFQAVVYRADGSQVLVASSNLTALSGVAPYAVLADLPPLTQEQVTLIAVNLSAELGRVSASAESPPTS